MARGSGGIRDRPREETAMASARARISWLLSGVRTHLALGECAEGRLDRLDGVRDVNVGDDLLVAEEPRRRDRLCAQAADRGAQDRSAS